MSASDENVFARWSRRKQAVRRVEAPTRDEEGQAPETAADVDAERPDPQLAVEPVAGEPPGALPSIEDLTAESDLSGFLRHGVPGALKNTALRKMWSLDPAIRDYIGPAEYAWDFNRPGSMAGFGPLKASASVAKFVSTMGRLSLPGSDSAAAASQDPQAPPPALQVTAGSSEQTGTDSPEGSTAASSQSGTVQRPHPKALHQPPPPADRLSAAEPAEQTRPAEPSQGPARPRHGGALPR
jgi:hypothetical protein